MKKILTSILILLLVGCAFNPAVVTYKFPDAPDELKKTCPDLSEVPAGTEKLSEVLTVVSANYNEYFECKLKADTWIEWYNMQKDIFNKIK